jgi:(hydroxyamino)benzene mutase
MKMEDKNRSLMWHGMFLFLLGLISGFVEQKFVNPRMGLAAHLEGVMNGTFLVALGCAWSYVRLSQPMKLAAYWIALYGTYVNWATTGLAAVLGTAALSQITGAGHHAQPGQEKLITALFMSVGIATVASTLLVLWGLRRVAVGEQKPVSQQAQNKTASSAGGR